MEKQKPDLEFLTRTLMALATEVADKYPDNRQVHVLLDAVLKELGVRNYPPLSRIATASKHFVN